MKDTYHFQALCARLNKNNEDFVKSNYINTTNNIGNKVISLLLTNSYNLIITSSLTGFITLEKDGKPEPVCVCNKKHMLNIDKEIVCDNWDYIANIIYEEIISHITDKENQIVTLHNALVNTSIVDNSKNEFFSLYDIIDVNKCNSIFDEFINKEE